MFLRLSSKAKYINQQYILDKVSTHWLQLNLSTLISCFSGWMNSIVTSPSHLHVAEIVLFLSMLENLFWKQKNFSVAITFPGDLKRLSLRGFKSPHSRNRKRDPYACSLKRLFHCLLIYTMKHLSSWKWPRL